MNTNRTIEQLKSLKLPGMADTYQSIESLALHDRPDLDQCIARMVEAEIQYRTESKMKMYLKLNISHQMCHLYHSQMCRIYHS